MKQQEFEYPKELIVRQQYTKMKPGWSLAIHRDVARQVALLIEFKPEANGDYLV